MAEHVTTARLGGPNPAARRLVGALADRLGDGSTVRAGNARDAQMAHEMLDGAASRLGLAAVEQHVCNHDIGEGICS
jgi:hypothetical protein